MPSPVVPHPPIGVFDARPYQEYNPGPARLVSPARLPASPRSILVVGLSASGDVLNFLPVAAALRRAFPSARLGWVVEDKARAVLDGFPAIDDIHVFERKRWLRGLVVPGRIISTLREILSSGRTLRSGGYDLLFDPQGSVKSALVNLASGVGARIGFARGYCRELNFLSTGVHVELPTRRMHRVRKSLALLEAVGVDTGEHVMVYGVPTGAQAEADLQLEKAGLAGKRFVVIHPGTSEFGARKRWPIERFGELAGRVRGELGLAPVFVLGPIERAWEAALLQSAKSAPAKVIHPSSFAHLAGILVRSACFVGSDSAPLHLASNLRRPVVGLYGPTDPVLFAPYYPPAVVVVKGLKCPRCGKPHCRHRVARMEAITVSEVMEGLGILLS